MNGGVVGAGCGAVGEGAGYEVGVYAGGEGDGGQAGFHGESVVLQPFKKGGLAKETSVWVLRRVGVGVWEVLAWYLEGGYMRYGVRARWRTWRR